MPLYLSDIVSNMKIATITFKLRAPWAHSLKEKRMIVNSLVAKLQNKFHASVAEIFRTLHDWELDYEPTREQWEAEIIDEIREVI